MKRQYITIDEYIEENPVDVQKILKNIKNVIIEAVPEAEETISYQMPSFKFRGKPLVYFAAFKSHIGACPTPSGMDEFREELKNYKQGKGSIQFPLDKPIPYELIKKIVKNRAEKIKESKSKK